MELDAAVEMPELIIDGLGGLRMSFKITHVSFRGVESKLEDVVEHSREI